MLFAVNLLNKKNGKKINSIIFEKIRVETRNLLSGEGNPNFGKTHSDETKVKIGKAMRGKKHSEKTRQIMSKKQSNNNNPMFNKAHTELSKDKMKAQQQINRSIKFYCEPCNKIIDKQNFRLRMRHTQHSLYLLR